MNANGSKKFLPLFLFGNVSAKKPKICLVDDNRILLEMEKGKESSSFFVLSFSLLHEKMGKIFKQKKIFHPVQTEVIVQIIVLDFAHEALKFINFGTKIILCFLFVFFSGLDVI